MMGPHSRRRKKGQESGLAGPNLAEKGRLTKWGGGGGLG